MAHIDYDHVTSLDALIDISDAGARAALIALRQQLARLGPALEERVVMDGIHRKPVIAFYRGETPLLHLFPEPGVGMGLHLSMPMRVDERRLMSLEGIPDWLSEAVQRARPRHNVVWVEATLHSPGRVDDVVDLLLRRLEFLPTLH